MADIPRPRRMGSAGQRVTTGTAMSDRRVPLFPRLRQWWRVWSGVRGPARWAPTEERRTRRKAEPMSDAQTIANQIRDDLYVLYGPNWGQRQLKFVNDKNWLAVTQRIRTMTDTAPPTRIRVVLGLLDHRLGHYRYATRSEDSDDLVYRLTVPLGAVKDLDAPDYITITIEPGDLLNEPNTDFTRTEDELPPNGVEVEVLNGPRHQRLVRDGGLWFLPDRSMYVYFTPKLWRYVGEQR